MTPIYPGRFSKTASLPRFPKGGARSIPRQPIERATKEKNKVHEYKGNPDGVYIIDLRDGILRYIYPKCTCGP